MESLIIVDRDTVNVPDHQGFTPLHYAVLNRRLDLVTILIEWGCYTNASDLRNRTPLHFAALNCETVIFEALNDRDVASSFDNLTNLDVLRYLLENGKACATIKDDCEQTPLEIICNCLSTHNLYINYEHPIVKCLEAVAPYTYSKEANYNFVQIFGLLYTGMRSLSEELVDFCIKNFYCDPDLNPRYHSLVKRYGELMREEGNGNLYQLCLLLHEDYGKHSDQLKIYIREINDLTFCFFTLSLDELIENDEAVQITQFCFRALKNEGIDFARSWFQEELSVSFDMMFKDFSQKQLYRIFKFFEYLFNLDSGVDFNRLALKFIENCFWSIRAGIPEFYENLLCSEIYFTFCSDTLISQKIAEEIYKMDEQWNQNVMIDYNRVLQNVERFLNVSTYNELANYCNFFSYIDIDYKVYSLKQMCRDNIRQTIGKAKPRQSSQEFIWRIMSLPIPMVLKKYLRFIEYNLDYLDFDERIF